MPNTVLDSGDTSGPKAGRVPALLELTSQREQHALNKKASNGRQCSVSAQGKPKQDGALPYSCEPLESVVLHEEVSSKEWLLAFFFSSLNISFNLRILRIQDLQFENKENSYTILHFYDNLVIIFIFLLLKFWQFPRWAWALPLVITNKSQAMTTSVIKMNLRQRIDCRNGLYSYCVQN